MAFRKYFITCKPNPEIMSKNKKRPSKEVNRHSFNQFIQQSISKSWDQDALTDYKGSTLKYKDVAEKIAKLHLLFENMGIRPGDKIALCGKNSSHWGVVFLSILTYGAVSVPILSDFKSDSIHHIVNHSDAVMLFVGDHVWENLDEQMMPHLKGIILLNDFSLLVSRSKGLTKAHGNLNMLMGQKYPKAFTSSRLSYYHDKPEELAYISYTSGTTSFSKGVMIPYRSLWSNLQFACDSMPLQQGDNHVCMLPLAHAFGLLFSFLFEFVKGCHVFFLTRTPSPKIIFSAYAEIKPNLIITVPLIVEKVVRKAVFPKLKTTQMKLLMHLPFVREKILQGIRKKIEGLFGGNVLELVIGGAALSEDVDRFMQMIHFPYTVGYGMTECGPLVCYAPSSTFVKGTCGRPVDRMSVKILSDDPSHQVGEIMVKGMNVMMGYYKNAMATREALSQDGWMHTGDLGTIDEGRNLMIRGRSKNMLLGPNGQNIYPEEIEEKLNTLPYVAESIVVQKDGKILALIHPDYNLAMEDGLSSEAIRQQMEANLVTLNAMIPKYSQVVAVKIFAEEFEKTPKRSIKRYLYM